MQFSIHRVLISIPAAAVAVALGLGGAVAAEAAGPYGHSTAAMTAQHESSSARTAQSRVRDAVQVVDQMKRSPALARVLERAKGVFILPHYGKGGLIFGGHGGGGVVLAHRASGWTSPAFYSVSGGSIGAQAGGESGPVAMILLTDKALSRFAQSQNAWSLNGNAGLTVVTWSGRGQVNTGRGDVVVWSNTKGLYGGLTASITRVSPDNNLDRAYYQQQVDARQILAGNVGSPAAAALRDALASRVASSGSAGSAGY